MLNYKALKKVNKKDDPLYVCIDKKEVCIMNKKGYYGGIIPLEDYENYIKDKFKYLETENIDKEVIINKIKECIELNVKEAVEVIDTNIAVEIEDNRNCRYLKLKGYSYTFINVDYFNIVKDLNLVSDGTYKPIILNEINYKFLILPVRVDLYKYPCLS
jgi:hypothetical protein